MNTETKRVTLFAGHYGSGKTNIAVNYAIMLREKGLETAIADLDIVNPYFRTKDSAELLGEKGIRLISSEFANTNVDFPALPSETYGVVRDSRVYTVIDVGGDDRGALALGRYTPFILEENNYEMLFVANLYRPLTRNAKDALEVMREIEIAGGIPFTAIINNSNVGSETTVRDVLDTGDEIKKLSELSGLPVRFTSVDRSIYRQFPDKSSLFPITLTERYYEIKRQV